MDNKKQFLCRYHNLQIKIEKKKQLIAEYERLAGSLPPISYDRIGSNPSPSHEAYFEKWVLRKIDAERELKTMESELDIIKSEILNAISAIENDELQMVLIYRYIDWLGWNTIQGKMYISRATAYRWHDEGMNLLKIK